VADIVHLSKNYFSFLFKKQTGLTFIDYLIELRIREAKRLLVQNEKRIYEVAALSGFKDVKYFGKMFKKGTGLTPLEYRKKHRKTESDFDEEGTV
jgi:two-component system response regulator YesN